MAEIRLKKVGINDIREYENNPRNNDKAVQPVINSIKKFGYVSPIIVDEDGVILAGHTRIQALRSMGAEEVEVIVISGLTEEERKSYRIADNRTREFAGWDGNLLQVEMREINADDWEQFGFKENEVKKFKPDNMCKCPKCGQAFVKV